MNEWLEIVVTNKNFSEKLDEIKYWLDISTESFMERLGYTRLTYINWRKKAPNSITTQEEFIESISNEYREIMEKRRVSIRYQIDHSK